MRRKPFEGGKNSEIDRAIAYYRNLRCRTLSVGRIGPAISGLGLEVP
jgi:hypothetical protein